MMFSATLSLDKCFSLALLTACLLLPLQSFGNLSRVQTSLDRREEKLREATVIQTEVRNLPTNPFLLGCFRVWYKLVKSL